MDPRDWQPGGGGKEHLEKLLDLVVRHHFQRVNAIDDLRASNAQLRLHYNEQTDRIMAMEDDLAHYHTVIRRIQKELKSIWLTANGHEVAFHSFPEETFKEILETIRDLIVGANLWQQRDYPEDSDDSDESETE